MRDPYSYNFSSGGNLYNGIFNSNRTANVPHVPSVFGPILPFLLSNDPSDPDELQNRFRIYSTTLLCTSIFFWGWAIYNTYSLLSTGGMDLGIVSFLGSTISSAFLLRSSQGGRFYDKNRRFGCFWKTKSRDGDDDVYSGGGEGTNANGYKPMGHAPPGSCLRAFALLTQATVVANYLLGLLFALTAGNQIYVNFATYCATFSLLWSLLAYFGWVLIGFYKEAVVQTYGEGYLNSLQNSGGERLENEVVNEEASAVSLDNNYLEEEEDEIDDELRALYEGPGKEGYFYA